MSKTYYCNKCKQRHISSKGIGKAHLEHAGEAPKVTPPPSAPTETPDVAEAPPRPRQGCERCNDTGVVLVGSHPVADGTERQYHTYCKCGQETHDERIGLTPRRPGLKPSPISDEDRAEADYRRGHGGSHEEYIATLEGTG